MSDEEEESKIRRLFDEYINKVFDEKIKDDKLSEKDRKILILGRISIDKFLSPLIERVSNGKEIWPNANIVGDDFDGNLMVLRQFLVGVISVIAIGKPSAQSEKYIKEAIRKKGSDNNKISAAKRETEEQGVLKVLIGGRDIAKPTKFVDDNLKSLTEACRKQNITPPSRSTWITRMKQLGYVSSRTKSKALKSKA